MRHSGDAPDVQQLQLFAWNAAARGNDVHVNANPTQGQLLHKEYIKTKEQLKDTTKVSILAKYGGEEYLEKAPKELLLGQTEEYVEFSRTGQVIKGKERAKVKSRYPEDGMCLFLHRLFFSFILNAVPFAVYVNNHTAIWGSWYDPSSGQWGYACCHSAIHLSYCTGEAGIEAAAASSAKNLLASSASSSMRPPPVPSSALSEPREMEGGERREDRKKKAEELFSKRRLGEGEVSIDQDRLAQAVSEEKKRKGRALADDDDERHGKRKKAGAAAGGNFEVTEEELGAFHLYTVIFYVLGADLGFAEAYRMSRRMADDPMANYVDTDV